MGGPKDPGVSSNERIGANHESEAVNTHVRRDSRTGQLITVRGYSRSRIPRPGVKKPDREDDAWLTGMPMRTVGHILAAFRSDVRKALGQEVPSRHLLNAWWTAVEETEWRELVENLRWLETFIYPLHDFFGHGRGRPPMVRELERQRANETPTGPSLDFRRYHMKRPDVYLRFREAAEGKRTEGHTHYSARKLLLELRAAGFAHAAMDLVGDYARKLMDEDESFRGFFRLPSRQ